MLAAFFWTSWISKAFSVKALRIPGLWYQRLVTALHIVTNHQNHPRTKENPFSCSAQKPASVIGIHLKFSTWWDSPESGPGKPCGLLKWCGWVTIPSSPLPTNLQMLGLFNCSAHTPNHRCSCGTTGQIRSWGRVFFLLGFYDAEHIWAWTVAFKEGEKLEAAS